MSQMTLPLPSPSLRTRDGWLEGEGLPAPVWMVVGALRKALKPETDRGLNGVPCVRTQARSGRWLTFHGADRVTTRLWRRNDGRRRTVETSRIGVAASVRIWVERTRTGGRGPRCAGCFHQGDLTDPLHLRVHRAGTSLECIRQGRSTRPSRPPQAPVLRQPLPYVVRVGHTRVSETKSANCSSSKASFLVSREAFSLN